MRVLILFPLLAAAASSALAHVGRGVPEGYEQLIKRQNGASSTEATAAAIDDPTEECTAYNLNSIGLIESYFPTVWTVADILTSDTDALTLMQTINASGLIPTDVAIRGTAPDSSAGTGLIGTYDLATDPDCWWTDKGCSSPKHANLNADVVSCPEPYTWGYSFDDGPNCTQNALYDYWATNNQKVSLMYIGSNVLDWPLQAQRAVSDGHHVCAHTWSHRYMTALTTDEAFAELYYTVKAIKYVMGITVTCWRPPYGDVDDRIRAIAQGMGLRTIMWSGDTNDWLIEPYGAQPTASIEANYASLKSIGSSPAAATGGIIVLEHELESAAMNLSMQELPSIKQSWKYVVPIAACLNTTKPYYEDYTYPDFANYIAGSVNPSPSGQTTFAIASVSFSLTSLPYNAASTSAPTATVSGTQSASTASAPVVGPTAAAVATSAGASASVSSSSSSSSSSTTSTKSSSSSSGAAGSVSFSVLLLVSVTISVLFCNCL
ncbi:hypothetical protein CBS101457_004851 [Exobasidium rhododendri]|nr:hypothetical protein CBS101457_004851 [Exobasidium rhododendri]